MNKRFEFQKAQFRYKNEVFNILEKAKKFQKINNINQWNNNYPTIKNVINDIESGSCYVMKISGVIGATASLSFVNVDTLKNQNDNNCILINRLAVDVELNIKGLGTKMMTFIEEYAIGKGAKYIVASTHKTNFIMQKLFSKCDFVLSEKLINHFSSNEYLYFLKKL